MCICGEAGGLTQRAPTRCSRARCSARRTVWAPATTWPRLSTAGAALSRSSESRSLILLGELAILTLAALPLGAVIGYGLGALIMTRFSNEIYRLSYVVTAPTIAWAFLTVMAAAFISGLLVRRRLDRLDLVAVLKGLE